MEKVAKKKLIKKQTEVTINGNLLILKVNGKEYCFKVNKISKRLAKATKEELNDFTVSPSGYGIHWSKIDEDISIPALLNEPETKYGREKKQ